MKSSPAGKLFPKSSSKLNIMSVYNAIVFDKPPAHILQMKLMPFKSVTRNVSFPFNFRVSIAQFSFSREAGTVIPSMVNRQRHHN
jgi:hypothetical protein